MSAQLVNSGIRNAIVACPLLKLGICRYDECRDKLSLVGDDGRLVDKLVDKEQGLYLLWCDILTVAGLEEVFYALLKEQLAIFQITGVACMEEAILVERHGIYGITLIVATCDGRALEQNLIVLANLYLYALDGTAHRAESIAIGEMVA